MIHVGLTEILETLAERHHDYQLHGDSLDWCARSVICKAVPPGARVPGPGAEQQQDTARACFERIYRDLCAGQL